ncbi:Aerobic respiration control sensor protein ArcB [Planctomycetes bacterium Poly30]|uniref:Aerobic respiration control sensor protein ArcB n=1 Tax=Saltatorellus ferox TaxID=2528018 RepID=A0A518EZ37_9BACT|nr:Aerobic respiration control sensor protein ArcB [Planctomycetes bacterium Poly30]
MSPLDQRPSPDSYRRLEAAVDEVLGAIRVLFVDDNTLACRIGCRVLTELGAQVQCATSGAEALALAEASEFDIIMLDCAMPGMSGFDVAQELRRPGARTANTPIVAVTETDAEGIRQQARQFGMAQVLCKPLSRDELNDQILSRRAQRMEVQRLEVLRSEVPRAEVRRAETGRAETGRAETGRAETGREEVRRPAPMPKALTPG